MDLIRFKGLLSDAPKQQKQNSLALAVAKLN